MSEETEERIMSKQFLIDVCGVNEWEVDRAPSWMWALAENAYWSGWRKV